MKSIIMGICVLGFVLAGVVQVFAGGAVNKNNLSVEYLRTLNRGAATDSADVASYNPAGTVVMEEGLYLNASVQHLKKEYMNTVGGTEYETDEPSTIPELYSVYRRDDWSAFFGVNVPVGGGTVEYDEGNATTFGIGQGLISMANSDPAVPAGTYDDIAEQRLKAESYGVGYTIGGAYRINETFSVGAGLKYVDSESEADGKISVYSTTLPPTIAPPQTANVDYKYTGTGLGGILSLDIFPSDKMVIGIKYDTPVRITYETEIGAKTNAIGNQVLSAQGITDGEEFRDDIPGFLTTAISYQFTDKLRFESDFVYYFNENAQLDGAKQGWDNGFDFGFCMEYSINDSFLVSAGFLLTETGADADEMTNEAPELDAKTVSGGIRWTVFENFDLNAALGYVSYYDATDSSGVELDKKIPWIGLGVQYKFF